MADAFGLKSVEPFRRGLYARMKSTFANNRTLGYRALGCLVSDHDQGVQNALEMMVIASKKK